jgi:Domain of unknown function (DUF4345)
LSGGGILPSFHRQRRQLAPVSHVLAVKLVAHVAHQRHPPAFPLSWSAALSPIASIKEAMPSAGLYGLSGLGYHQPPMTGGTVKINQLMLVRVVLVIVGAFIVYVGINVGFGGIPTLGWQVPTDFVSVANPAEFAVQDSHVRFLGGFFGAAGLFMLLAATNLRRYPAELRLVFVLMFIGGLMRLTAFQPAVLFGPKVITSFAAEVILMPILFFWLPRALRSAAPTQPA